MMDKILPKCCSRAAYGGAPAAKKGLMNHSCANQLCLNMAGDKNLQTVLHFNSYYPNSNLSD